ncbi:hypothetical protein VTN96DRAFT_10284 [Rasamsonia emersonii]
MFYYPCPRAIEPDVAKALATGLACIYFVPIVQTVSSLGELTHDGSVSALVRAWNMTHFGVLCRELFSLIPARTTTETSARTRKDGPKEMFGALDMPSLARLYAFFFAVTSVAHVVFISKYTYALRNTYSLTGADDIANLSSLSLTILTWCLFTAWDLRRVNIVENDILLRRAWLAVVIGSAVVGPAATLAATWWWREREMERARGGKKTQQESEWGWEGKENESSLLNG